jgi:hypothetical protein
VSGLVDVERTIRIHTGMGADLLVHPLAGVPGAVVLDFVSYAERPEVLVPVTGGPAVTDSRIKPPAPPAPPATPGDRFAVLLAEALKSDKSRKCAAHGYRRVKPGPKRKKRRGRQHAQTEHWLD